MADTLPPTPPAGFIRLYVVGIYFYRDLKFVADPSLTSGGVEFMSGGQILAAAHAQGLEWTVNQDGHLESLTYTPKDDDPTRLHPSTKNNRNPYIGKALTLVENLAPVNAESPTISQILQFTSDGQVSAPPKDGITGLQADAQFVPTGFAERSFIRVRQIGIYRKK